MVFGLIVTGIRASVAVARVSSRSDESTQVPYGRFDNQQGSGRRNGVVACVTVFFFVGVAAVIGIIFGLRSHSSNSSPSGTDFNSPTDYEPVDPGYPEFTNPPELPDIKTHRPYPVTPRPAFAGKYASVARSMYDMMSGYTKPCNDFYKYACGNWMASHPATGYKSHDQFTVVNDDVRKILHRELESRSTGQPDAIQTAKRFYRSCKNEYQINMRKGTPLQKFRNVLYGSDVTSTMVQMGMFRGFPLAVLEVITDPRNSNNHILVLDQPSLPLRDLNFVIRPALEDYIREVKRLLTRDVQIDYSFFGDLDELLSTHEAIADMTMKEGDRPDVSGRYHKFTLGQLRMLYPGFDWKKYVQQTLARPELNIAVDDSEPILVYAPDYFRRVSRYLLTASPMKIIRFMRWNFIHRVLSDLSYEYKVAINKLYSVAKLEYKEPVRWKTCVKLTDQLMGNATGRLLVKANFDRDSINTVTEMVSDIRTVFAKRILQDNWMDKATTSKAIGKLNAIRDLVGYPDEIMNDAQLNSQYQDVKVQDGAHFENMMFFLKRIQVKSLQKLRQPTNRHRWTVSPTTVNAFYDPEKNIIVIPAGILRKPFYSADYPKSVLYASLGMIVAHEMTHGFDNKGSKFDKEGSLRDWWTPGSARAYRQKEQCYKHQYSAYTVPGLTFVSLNGTKTLAENIADNGGVKDAFQAYTEWLSRNNTEATLSGLGLNHQQAFYLAFAQRWCETRGSDSAKLYNDKATHSPGAIRVKGTLQNSDHFAQTFSCRQGSPMSPYRRCKMW